MSHSDTIPYPETILLPDIPAIFATAQNGIMLSTDGEVVHAAHQDIITAIQHDSALVCHAPYTCKRLNFNDFNAFDILELFAFVHPTRFCVPTPVGVAKALFCDIPRDIEDYPFTLVDCAQRLLQDLQNDPFTETASPLKIAGIMGLRGKGWNWTPFIFKALGHDYDITGEVFSRAALNVWKHLPEWADDPPEPPASHHGVTAEEAHDKLSALLNVGDRTAELRPQQKSYSADIAEIFSPMDTDESPHIALAEAGTGVGKTLGYLAPAAVWSEKNEGTVWISTYTKNLQRQINSELDRLYPHPIIKDAYVSIRKGRENYLCLLNLEDMAAQAGTTYTPRHAVAAGLMARWAAATKDGDLSGGDFAGWLSGLLGLGNTYGLADRRGECIFSACDHYHRCFVERSIRKAKRARLVVANHALVMIQSAMSGTTETLPTRYIFDEGHHLFDAADSAFSSHLTAREAADLRRWILGNEGGRTGRARGLKKRVEDLLAGDTDAIAALEDIIHNARTLCAQGWSHRFKDKAPHGATEIFLMSVYRVVHARADNVDTPYSLETGLFPVDDGLREDANTLKAALQKLLTPMKTFSHLLIERLNADEGEMDGDTRKRLDALASSLERRGQMSVQSWIAQLDTLLEGTESKGFVDWLAVERIDGKSVDVGIYRHYTDPMKPFAASIRPHVHGMAITSATLHDKTDDDAHNLAVAQARTGTHYMTQNVMESRYHSPYDYAKNTRIYIVNDVNKQNLDQVANAYQALFKASHGGALGLFTAIQRLRAVHSRIAMPLEAAGIPLYGQHCDDIDTSTLIDIFRDDVNACLLGTDAVRDGVDIPGESLRLLVFDRVPWPRPSLLHKARRDAFGQRAYDEMLTRLKLKQAFGRLIRKADDRGVFVMLDNMLPSRLHSAFPPDVEIVKTDLKTILADISEFFDRT